MLLESGKPWQNGTNESFNGKFRDECLAMSWFHSRKHAKVLIEQSKLRLAVGLKFRGTKLTAF
jgi:putative transposase